MFFYSRFLQVMDFIFLSHYVSYDSEGLKKPQINLNFDLGFIWVYKVSC